MSLMDKKQKDETFRIFSEAFHDVVVPLFEEIKQNMVTKEDIYRLERKIEKGTERMDRHGKTIEDHEKRIKSLEVN